MNVWEYKDVIQFLERHTPVPKDRSNRVLFQTVLQALGHPEQRIPAIHVAGTNGKGAVSMMITNGLVTAGKRVGTYLSPFVYDIRERWLIDGKPVSVEHLSYVSDRVRRTLDVVETTGPVVSTFEIKTLVAFELFHLLALDIMVIEVGIGGLLDATNVIPAPEVAIITSIGLDHSDLLGNSIAEIAAQKAGIIKAGTKLVLSGVDEPETRAVIDHTAHRFDINVEYPEPVTQTCLLPGRHQKQNAALAHRAVTFVCKNIQDVLPAILETTLPGRFETKIVMGRILVFDGAHNPAAAHTLCQAVRERFPCQQITLVVAHTGGHDSQAFADELIPIVNQIYVTQTQFRPIAVDVLLRNYNGFPASIVSDTDMFTAVDKAIQATPQGDIVLITGSFYLAPTFQRLKEDSSTIR